ncbi:hypothetical protein BU17DRAFT_61040 [Hysterangium stoloniferum]|nr:hypothetical protein BU17DRAFT_61040 [Hysterangium stoloniferum]
MLGNLGCRSRRVWVRIGRNLGPRTWRASCVNSARGGSCIRKCTNELGARQVSPSGVGAETGAWEVRGGGVSIEDREGSKIGGGEMEGAAGVGDAVVGPGAAAASTGSGMGDVGGGRDGCWPRRERGVSDDEGLDFDLLLGGISRYAKVTQFLVSFLQARYSHFPPLFIQESTRFYWGEGRVNTFLFWANKQIKYDHIISRLAPETRSEGVPRL